MTSHGVRFALDDFGTGVSSLAYLKNLEISTIKLDGSYVRDVLTNTRSQALVRAIVQLADSMGITTVAEYVESNSVRDRLAALGIQFGQGYALGRPGPLDDVIAAVADSCGGRARNVRSPKTRRTPRRPAFPSCSSTRTGMIWGRFLFASKWRRASGPRTHSGTWLIEARPFLLQIRMSPYTRAP